MKHCTKYKLVIQYNKKGERNHMTYEHEIEILNHLYNLAETRKPIVFSEEALIALGSAISALQTLADMPNIMQTILNNPNSKGE